MKRLFICVMLALPLAISAQTERGKIFQNEYNLNVLNHRIDSVVAATKGERLPVIGIGHSLLMVAPLQNRFTSTL